MIYKFTLRTCHSCFRRNDSGTPDFTSGCV